MPERSTGNAEIHLQQTNCVWRWDLCVKKERLSSQGVLLRSEQIAVNAEGEKLGTPVQGIKITLLPPVAKLNKNKH